MNTTTNTTTTRPGRGQALPEEVRRGTRGDGHDAGAELREALSAALREGPRDARTRPSPGSTGSTDSTRSSSSPRTSSAGASSVWRVPLLALLEYAELDVLEYPDERARVEAVRRAVNARFDRRPMPPLDLRDLAFTAGLIAKAIGGERSDQGWLSQGLRLLSPSAFAEYQRAQGFVRVTPPFRD